MSRCLVHFSLVVVLVTIFSFGGRLAHAGFLDFPIMGYTASTAPVTAVMDHDGSVNGSITTYAGETGWSANGCIAYVNGRNVSCTLSNTNAPRGYKKSNGKAWNVSAFKYRDDIDGKNLYMWYDGHRGYDFAVARWIPVSASARGKVTSINVEWGQVELDHSDYGYKYKTTYTHMRLNMPLPPVVSKGSIIGWVYDSAPQNQPVGPHLHYVVHKRSGNAWVMVDPYGGSGEPRLWK